MGWLFRQKKSNFVNVDELESLEDLGSPNILLAQHFHLWEQGVRMRTCKSWIVVKLASWNVVAIIFFILNVS